MTPCIIFLWIFSAVVSSTADETIVFDIVRNEKLLGELHASKSNNGEWTIYESKTAIKTHILKKIEVVYESQVKFRNGSLHEAVVTMTINGNLHSATQTKRAGDTYQFFKNGKLDRAFQGNITYSSAMLLFQEPVGIDTVYSEEGGIFFDIVLVDVCAYDKVNAKGRKSRYHYKNQDLQSVTIDAGMVEFDMILRSQN